MSGPTVERHTHERWGESIRLSNGTVDVLAPTTIGPRIVHFGFVNGDNEFFQFPEGRETVPRFGGHRLWHAPEDDPRTYNPDADPVETTTLENGVRLVGPVEEHASLLKAMTVRMSESGASVAVEHELTNRNPWPIEFAPWAISVLQPGGTAVLPLTPQAPEESLLPDRSVQVWPYTSLSDRRIDFDDGRVLLSQKPGADPTKLGTSGGDGWIAYVNDGHAFRTDYEYDPTGTYPDMGSVAEAYTDDTIMEVETLAPLRTVEPGETATHNITWTLADGIDSPAGVADIEPTEI